MKERMEGEERGRGAIKNTHFTKDNLILLTESYGFLFYFYTLSNNMYVEILNLNEDCGEGRASYSSRTVLLY